MEIAVDEHLRLQQRLIDQEFEGDGQQPAFFGRQLEPQVFLEDEILTVADVIPGFQLLVRDALQD